MPRDPNVHSSARVAQSSPRPLLSQGNRMVFLTHILLGLPVLNSVHEERDSNLTVEKDGNTGKDVWLRKC